MNSEELDIFLREHTFYEKFLLQNIKNDSKTSLESFIKNNTYDKKINKKLPMINDNLIEEFSLTDSLINFQKPFKDNIVFNRTDDITFVCHPRFADTSEHRHDYIEMIYVYSGEITQIVNGHKINMTQGDVCILDTNVLHSINKTSENDIIINCVMSKKYLDEILLSRLSDNNLISSFFIHAIYQSNDYNDYILFKSGNSKKLSSLMVEVLCEYFDSSICTSNVINSYMIIIFSELVRIFEKQTNSENYDILKNTKITDIILYIQNNCESATLYSVAEHFHFNPSYLGSVIKKFQGSNFTSILQEAKLKKACFLLKNSDLSIIDVTKAIGYENTNFFYKIFKKNYGCNPTEFRKKSRDKYNM